MNKMQNACEVYTIHVRVSVTYHPLVDTCRKYATDCIFLSISAKENCYYFWMTGMPLLIYISQQFYSSNRLVGNTAEGYFYF